MSRLSEAITAVLVGRSGGDVAQILSIPKRTADRWLAELRDGDDLGNWPGTAIERLAAWESLTWGTVRIAEALLPEDAAPVVAAARIHVDDVVRIMRSVSDSHRINATLLTDLAAGLSDGRIEDHEARALLPATRDAQQAAAAKLAALAELAKRLERHLRG